MRLLRIAIFSDSFFPITNGVSQSISLLVEELRSRGHSVSIFSARYPGHKDSDPNVIRFLSVVTPVARDYPLSVPPYFPYYRYFRLGNFDIVHTHTPFLAGNIGMRWARRKRIPLVSTYHTLYEKYAHYVPFIPHKITKRCIAMYTHWYYNHCEEIITPSRSALRFLKHHHIQKPITVIPTGIPTPPILSKAEARAQLGVKPEERMLLYVGRIAREKNIHFLFEALIHLIRKEQVRLWLVGDGPAWQECADKVRELGIGDHVVFVGAVPRKTVDVYYASADVFTFASVTETQGLVLGEAMSFGLPVVVVQGGAASHAVQDGVTGLISSPDPQEFSSKVLQILENEGLWHRLSEGALNASRNWSVSTMTDAVLEVYQRVLQRAPSPNIESAREQNVHSRIS